MLIRNVGWGGKVEGMVGDEKKSLVEKSRRSTKCRKTQSPTSTKSGKTTTPSIPVWSPTTVLTGPALA
jgi:hypothetical protein